MVSLSFYQPSLGQGYEKWKENILQPKFMLLKIEEFLVSYFKTNNAMG